VTAPTLTREQRDEIEEAEIREILADAADERAALRALLASKSSVYGSYLGGRWADLRTVGDELGGFVVVETIEGDDRRWSRAVEVIVCAPSGTHYRWSYDSGLTEYQDDDLLDGDPVVVEQHEEEVVVRTWKAASAA
jgi:hypothetical protein